MEKAEGGNLRPEFEAVLFAGEVYLWIRSCPRITRMGANEIKSTLVCTNEQQIAEPQNNEYRRSEFTSRFCSSSFVTQRNGCAVQHRRRSLDNLGMTGCENEISSFATIRVDSRESISGREELPANNEWEWVSGPEQAASLHAKRQALRGTAPDEPCIENALLVFTDILRACRYPKSTRCHL